MKIVLPWPPSILNPNARCHWAKVGTAKKKYRAACLSVASQVKPSFPEGKVNLLLTFMPPDKRRRDDDNMLSSFKAGRDGIAEAWGVDDSRFRVTIDIGEPVKNGCVIVEVL